MMDVVIWIEAYLPKTKTTWYMISVVLGRLKYFWDGTHFASTSGWLEDSSDNHSLHGLASFPGPCQKVGEGMGMRLHMVHTPLRQTLSVFCSLGLQ